jgi:Fur family ferric uptake transcriptional regulator
LAGPERTTQQKVAIEQAFEQCPRPLAVAEVHQIATKACDTLGIATVYRAINRLVQNGWLTEVHLPNKPTRYERKSLAHHHHFHCEKCEIVYDVQAPCEALSTNIPSGFQVHRHELTFYGVCEDCRVDEISDRPTP